MACNTLLMSDDAEFSVKPELEIFADDVQCGHGATVADIDDNHLYYLMARGIPKNKARAMLVNAFVAEIVEELEDEAWSRRWKTSSRPGSKSTPDWIGCNGQDNAGEQPTTSKPFGGIFRSCRRRSMASRWSISTMAPRPRSRRW